MHERSYRLHAKGTKHVILQYHCSDKVNTIFLMEGGIGMNKTLLTWFNKRSQPDPQLSLIFSTTRGHCSPDITPSHHIVQRSS